MSEESKSCPTCSEPCPTCEGVRKIVVAKLSVEVDLVAKNMEAFERIEKEFTRMRFVLNRFVELGLDKYKAPEVALALLTTYATEEVEYSVKKAAEFKKTQEESVQAVPADTNATIANAQAREDL